MATGPNDRLTNFLYTVEITGPEGVEEKKIQTVSGLGQKTVNDTEWSTSDREDFVSFPGRVEFDDITMTYHPELSDQVKGKPGTPYPNFIFEVYIGENSEPIGRTRSVDGMGVEADVIENDEGRKLTPMKQIGQRHYNDITIDQVYGNPGGRVFENFADKLADAGPRGGGAGQVRSEQFDDSLNNVRIVGLKRDRTQFFSLTAQGSWASELSTEDLDAEGEDVLLKSLTIQPSAIEVHSGLGNGSFNNWANLVFGQPKNYKRDLTVRAYPRNETHGPSGSAVAKWKVYEAWVSQVETGTLDAENDDPWTVDATIVHEGSERTDEAGTESTTFTA